MRNCIHCGSYVDKYQNHCPKCGRVADGLKSMRLRGLIGFLSLGLGIIIGLKVSWWLMPIIFLGGTFAGNKIIKRGMN